MDFRIQLEAIYLSSSNKAKSTWAKHRQCLALLEGSASSPEQIDFESIARVREKIKAGGSRPATINSLMRVVRTQCNLLRKMQWLGVNPFDCGIDLFERENRGDRVTRSHSLAEVCRVLSLADHEFARSTSFAERWKAARVRALVYLLAHTGLRAGEALRLTTANVHLAEMRVRVSEQDGRLKTQSSERVVPLSPWCVSVLVDWREFLHGKCFFPTMRDDRPWLNGNHPHRPSDVVRLLGERAGVPGFTPHSLRHTFVNLSQIDWGFTGKQVQRVVGHSSITTQEHYERSPEWRSLVRMMERVHFSQLNLGGNLGGQRDDVERQATSSQRVSDRPGRRDSEG